VRVCATSTATTILMVDTGVIVAITALVLAAAVIGLR
jgi:hypothetical protein